MKAKKKTTGRVLKLKDILNALAECQLELQHIKTVLETLDPEMQIPPPGTARFFPAPTTDKKIGCEPPSMTGPRKPGPGTTKPARKPAD